jgi:hypothetical protein
MQDLYNATAALHLSIGELIEAIRTNPVLSNAEKLNALKFLKSGLSAAQATTNLNINELTKKAINHDTDKEE